MASIRLELAATLPPGYERSQIVYRAFMEMTYTELQDATGMTEGELKSDVRRLYNEGWPRKGRGKAPQSGAIGEEAQPGGKVAPLSHESGAGATFDPLVGINPADQPEPSWARRGPRFAVSAYVYRGERPSASVPRFTGYWELEGDFLVINDVHIPATNWAFAELALQVAETHLPRPRRCILVGDLINGDALSRWEDLVMCTPLEDELDYANQYLNVLGGVFDEIWFMRGNHEDRLLKSLRGQLNAPQFLRMVSDNTRVHYSTYSKCTVSSGGELWRLTHQRAYRKRKLSVANELAMKYKAHIISAHQHHSAQGRDDSNTYTIIDSGGLHDSELMAYVQLDDTTSPVMCNGFVLLREGVGTLFTPPSYCMTDWQQWQPAMQRRMAA